MLLLCYAMLWIQTDLARPAGRHVELATCVKLEVEPS
jgi:hypothetical protein